MTDCLVRNRLASLLLLSILACNSKEHLGQAPSNGAGALEVRVETLHSAIPIAGEGTLKAGGDSASWTADSPTRTFTGLKPGERIQVRLQGDHYAWPMDVDLPEGESGKVTLRVLSYRPTNIEQRALSEAQSLHVYALPTELKLVWKMPTNLSAALFVVPRTPAGTPPQYPALTRAIEQIVAKYAGSKSVGSVLHAPLDTTEADMLAFLDALGTASKRNIDLDPTMELTPRDVSTEAERLDPFVKDHAAALKNDISSVEALQKALTSCAIFDDPKARPPSIYSYCALPTLARLWLHLGEAQLAQGQQQLAEGSFRFATVFDRAATLDPGASPDAMNALATVKQRKRATVEMRDFSAPLACDTAKIEQAITSQMGRFEFCYDLVAQGTPKLAGRADLHFVIGADGATGAVRFDEGTTPDALKDCLTKVIRRLVFEPPPQNVGVCAVKTPIQYAPPN